MAIQFKHYKPPQKPQKPKHTASASKTHYGTGVKNRNNGEASQSTAEEPLHQSGASIAIQALDISSGIHQHGRRGASISPILSKRPSPERLGSLDSLFDDEGFRQWLEQQDSPLITPEPSSRRLDNGGYSTNFKNQHDAKRRRLSTTTRDDTLLPEPDFQGSVIASTNDTAPVDEEACNSISSSGWARSGVATFSPGRPLVNPPADQAHIVDTSQPSSPIGLSATRLRRGQEPCKSCQSLHEIIDHALFLLQTYKARSIPRQQSSRPSDGGEDEDCPGEMADRKVSRKRGRWSASEECLLREFKNKNREESWIAGKLNRSEPAVRRKLEQQDKQKEWEVDAVQARSGSGKHTFYYIRWTGFPEGDSWVRKKDISEGLVQEFETQYAQDGEFRSRADQIADDFRHMIRR